ncbi:diaminobutyrate acetyltransferase [Photobacterium sp. ZSDE20]|uniref:L-2,4-diaminobutyric acid acetyltransferase n=1 Tax=Photobacterium pectinilyticum TaxID=2906793 RepID=A0ABT1N7H0_9GAMM|nr:diaminobutyrate acetyltransferase [Photobacterium sp. ZSDE20]MCQ1060676.1 diaminobutyrate acetyltransferase [Photobacterium sp. ZSDE20]MDD1828225.1 diaminobutyrate acetyltransferase [Photobacterium sp. ZSDE20]
MITSAPWMPHSDVGEDSSPKWNFREPNRNDGDDVYRLIANCPPLDMNSSYCNFLQSTHFSKTCILAEKNSEIAGFISAYQKPDEQNVLFVWQVAVAPFYRGKGLAFVMLKALLGRKGLENITVVETTITKENEASWTLFQKLDLLHGKLGEVTTFLDEKDHFKDKHDTEYLYRIPLK